MVSRTTKPAAAAPPQVQDDGGGAAAPLDDDSLLDETSDVERIRVTLGGLTDGESKCLVYRTGVPGKRDVFLFECDPSEFNLSALQASYGAGIFRMRVYGVRAEGGKQGLQVNQRFEVGEPLARRAPVVDHGGQSDMARILAALVDEVRTLRMVPVAAPVDPMAGMRNALEMMTMMRGLMPDPAPPAPAVDPLLLIKQMREMRAFGEELAGNAPEAAPQSEWAGLAGAAGALLAAIKPQTAAVPAAEVDPRQLPLVGVEQGEAEPAPQQDEGEDMSMMMRLAVGRLLKAAQAGTPHAEVADTIMQFASDEMILGIVEPDAWFDVVLQVAPEAAPHRGYFESLRAEILSRYPADQEGAPGLQADGSRPL